MNDEPNQQVSPPPLKRKPGRPPRNPYPQAPMPQTAAPQAPMPEARRPEGPKWQLTETPNWTLNDVSEEEGVDRLHISPELRARLPQDLDFLWGTEEIYGQPQTQHQGKLHRGGWTPLHGNDLGGALDGVFTPRGSKELIRQGGLVLMCRPLELSKKAKRQDNRRAMEQVAIKEQAWKSGELDRVTLDPQHPTTLAQNKIGRSIEQVRVPTDE